MKRNMSVIIILIITLSFAGCVALYQGERPYDYGPGKWISESPDIWFEVTSQDEDNNYIHPEGQINIDGQTIDFRMFFNKAKSVSFFNADETEIELFSGTCEFGSDKFVVNLDKDTIFYGKVDKIEFIKEITEDSQ